MPRYVSREGYVGTDWRLMIDDRGVCEVTGRLVTTEEGAVTTDAISLEAAQKKVQVAVASGTYGEIDEEAKLIAIRAVSYAADRYSWEDETQCVPVWEFDFLKDDRWVSQLCVDRQTGELLNPNERPAAKMEAM